MRDLTKLKVTELITTAEAAELTGRDQSVFRHAVLKETLNSIKLGGVLFLDRREVLARWDLLEPDAEPDAEAVA